MPKFKVLITDCIWSGLDIETRVLAECDATPMAAPDGKEETLAALARDAHGILTCFAPVTPRVLQAASNCVVVARYGVGVDNIAVDAATKLGMLVTYVPDYCMDEVSDQTMGYIIALNRRFPAFERLARQGNWASLPLDTPVLRLRGSVLGIMGLGRIGRAVCLKARAFGMEALAFDPYISEDDFQKVGATPCSREELLKRSDFVTVHTPLNEETRGLISQQELRLMKPSAFLINCARGPIVDEAALVEALRQGWIAGAGLDVLQSSHPPASHPLFSMDNVIVTPHTAFFSQQSLQELRARAAQSVVAVLKGQMPEHVYNIAVLPHARAKVKAS